MAPAGRPSDPSGCGIQPSSCEQFDAGVSLLAHWRLPANLLLVPHIWGLPDPVLHLAVYLALDSSVYFRHGRGS